MDKLTEQSDTPVVVDVARLVTAVAAFVRAPSEEGTSARLAALYREVGVLRSRLDELRARDPDGDPDHDDFVSAADRLSDCENELESFEHSRRLVLTFDDVHDDALLDFVSNLRAQGIGYGALYARGSTLFGRSGGRAEYLFAVGGGCNLPEPTQTVPLLLAAVDQGYAEAAVALAAHQPERAAYWRERAAELGLPHVCLERGKALIVSPRTPQRLAQAAELLARASADPRCGDEAAAYLSCLFELGWVTAPKVEGGWSARCLDRDVRSRVRRSFGMR